MKDYLDYPHQHYDIHIALNHTIDKLEENYKAFNTRLAVEEKYCPNHYYHSHKSEIVNAIAQKEQEHLDSFLNWSDSLARSLKPTKID